MKWEFRSFDNTVKFHIENKMFVLLHLGKGRHWFVKGIDILYHVFGRM